MSVGYVNFRCHLTILCIALVACKDNLSWVKDHDSLGVKNIHINFPPKNHCSLFLTTAPFLKTNIFFFFLIFMDMPICLLYSEIESICFYSRITVSEKLDASLAYVSA